MAGLIGRRLLVAVGMLFGMSVLVFLLLRLVPGDPANAILGPYSTPELVAQVHQELGLDKPLPEQYVIWLSDVVLHFDFGTDYQSGQPISELMAQRLPVTLELGLLAFVVSVLIGLPTGVGAALRRGRMTDRILQAAGVVAIAIPPFWFGIMLILVFALTVSWFPTSGYVPISEGLGLNLRSLTLPVVALALERAAVLQAMTRASMSDVLGHDYMRFNTARGLSRSRVVWKHGLRNASIPVVTVAGLQIAHLIGASVLIEQVFSLPGIGQLLVQSMLNRNYPVVQATVLVAAIITVLATLLTDIAYVLIDPRLRKVKS